MKFIFQILMLTNIVCNKSILNSTNCFKGKLVLKGLCMNYVIQIIEGNVDSSLYESSWQNPSSGVVYTNVFGLASICTFPSTLNEGDEFYFSIPKNPTVQLCAQCKAYSPIPSKKINIEICNQ